MGIRVTAWSPLPEWLLAVRLQTVITAAHFPSAPAHPSEEAQ